MTSSEPEPSTVTERAHTDSTSPAKDHEADAAELVGDAEYESAFNEKLEHTLDVDTRATGIDWEGAVARLKSEIRSAVEREEALTGIVRKELLPKIGKSDSAPSDAGVYQVTGEEIEKIHQGLLFPGRVEAVDATSASHDTLPLGITQIGIAVVSYGGVSATFSQRVFRKEIAAKGADPIKAALEIIDRRDSRAGVGQKEGMSELARRGVMTFGERKILLDKATADWRMGHGAPVPYELLTGSGSMRLLEASLDVLKRMIEFERFVFIPSAPGERGLLTLGNALAAGEYAVLGTIQRRIERVVEQGHYAVKKHDYKGMAMDFVRKYGPEVLYGLYCASESSPPYMFYAHRKHVHIAARIAIADSVLRPARGFPMLIDVADVTCRSAFGSAGFVGLVHDAYMQSGVPMKYFGERETRR